VFSCDYNGWADVPEDEREALEAFEVIPPPPANPPSVVVRGPGRRLSQPHRKAA
jgi:hypothetical protein